MSGHPSRLPASFRHRPTFSRHQSSSNQASLPHSRNSSRHESAGPHNNNDEGTPLIFVQSEARPASSRRTASAPTASASTTASRTSLRRAVRSMFTSRPVSENPDSRLPTAHAPLLDNVRTIADGFALPSNMQSVHHPTIAHRTNSGPPIASRQNNHEPSAYPATERTISRVQTQQALLMDNERTHYDGMAAPSHLRSVYPTIATLGADRRPSSDGRLGAVIRPGASRPPSSDIPSSNSRLGSTIRPDASRIPSSGSSNGGHLSNVEPTSRPNSEARPSSSGRPSARSGSNGAPRSNAAQTMQMNGLVPIQENERENENRSHPATAILVSNPPAHAGTLLRTPRDQVMASRQRQITSMQPAERSRQEAWAQSMLRATPHSCPQGYGFKRTENPPGYRCKMGGHCIPDELLSEGRGGICIVPGAKINKMDILWGPYYEGPRGDGTLVYGGDPNQAAPSIIEARGTYKFDKAWRLHPDLNGPPTRQSEVDRINREYGKIKGPLRKPLTLAELTGNGRYN